MTEPTLPPGQSFREQLSHEIEETASRVLKRNVGRRWADHVKSKSAYLLVIGVLMQGGFLYFASRLVNMGEEQLNRERAMLAVQHQELVQAIRDQTLAVRELTAACRATAKP